MAKFNMNAVQFAVVACVLFAGWASAQGHMKVPLPIQGDADIVGYNNNADGCGLTPDLQFKYTVAQQNPSMTVYPGQTLSITYMANGPLGFGPIYVRFDSAGTGSKYDYMATVTSNLAGTNGYLASSPSGYYPNYSNITFTVPQNIQCNNNLCLMQVLNQQAYVSCSYVRLTTSPSNTLVPVSTGSATLYGGSLVQAKLERLEALVDILKNLGVDARVLFQSNFDVADLIRRLVSVIN